jgi:uncharacterized low-complexity protein
MDAPQKKAIALKIVVALGLGAVSYVVAPGSANADGVSQPECLGNSCGAPSSGGGGCGSGSGSAILSARTPLF